MPAVPVVTTSHPNDILSREVGFCLDASAIARAIHPWVRKNPRFTQGAALKLIGVTEYDAPYIHPIAERLQKALTLLQVVRTALKVDGVLSVYEYPVNKVVVVKDHVDQRITAAGFSVDPDDPSPEEDQVEFCRDWIRRHCRRRLTLNQSRNTYTLKHHVEAWSRTRPDTLTKQQRNSNTGDLYFSDTYYVSQGALMVAAIREGYDVKQFQQSHQGHMNMSIRKAEDQPFRGRNPIDPVAVRAVKQEAARLNKDPEILPRRRFLKFLGRKHSAFLAGVGHRRGPVFTLREGASAMQIKFAGDRPPPLVTKLMKEAGCIRLKLQVDKHEEQKGWRSRHTLKFKAWWVRYADMPELWRMGNSHLDPVNQGNDSEPTLTSEEEGQDEDSQGCEVAPEVQEEAQ